jgi:adenosylcobinamide-GDP ribazoletransferase
MKDSHIGTYGVLALLIVSLIRWSALTQLLSSGSIWPALIAAGALSRTPMAIVMAALPNARGSGLSQSVGRPAVSTVVGAITVSLVVAGFAVGHALVATLFPLAVTTFVVMSVARRRIGGQTGDILGASQQLGDAAILVTLATTLT